MIGNTLGHYKVTERIGAGGMGVVYKARDLHLDRFVALKILPPEKVADPERRRRFVQEAKAASALNHPNIVTIHDITQEGGTDFIVMEYVEGKTLDQRIGHRGLRLNDALKYAVQIADALAKAHSAGIVHRDLKPTNIMVNEDGVMKVLDFGLAKLTEQIQGDESASTATVDGEGRPITEEGVIVGTVSYMSPEQAEGKKVDARSDIFSLGSVLYEMVTGQKAFQGTSKMSTLSAILHQEPKPVSGITPAIPSDLDKLINRCLRKDPAKRLQHMDDVKLALEELKEDSDSGRLQAAPAGAKKTSLLRLVVVAVVVVAFAVAGWYWLGRRHGAEPEVPLTAVPLTSYPGMESSPSFSPDGNQMAFSWNGEKEGNSDIYIKLIGAEPPMRLTTDPANEDFPAWSPDGRWIAFLRQLSKGKFTVVLMPPIPGSERVLTEAYISEILEGPFLSWSPDSRWLAVASGPKPGPEASSALWLISLDSNEKRQITFPTGLLYDGCPAFSPDGHALAFFRWSGMDKSDLYLLDLFSDLKPKGEPKCLVVGKGRASGLDWTVDGRSLIYSMYSGQASNLWRVAVSGPSPPQRLTSIGTNGSRPAISHRGNRLAYVHAFDDWNIWRMEIPSPKSNASLPIKLISSTRLEWQPRFSPDGKKIAFVSDRSGSLEVWVCNADSSNPVQLTFFAAAGVAFGENPWSPDGSRLVFSANPEGVDDVFVVNANGGGLRRLIPDRHGSSSSPFWSRDGRWIFFDMVDSGKLGIYKSPAADGAPVLVADDPGYAPLESSDGKFIYYYKTALDGAGTSLWRVPSSGGEKQQFLDLVENRSVQIADDGIYFKRPEKETSGVSIQFLNTTTGRIQRVASWPGGAGSFSVSPDRRWIVYGQADQSGSDLMLVENFR